jgi:hypothetical protein
VHLFNRAVCAVDSLRERVCVFAVEVRGEIQSRVASLGRRMSPQNLPKLVLWVFNGTRNSLVGLHCPLYDSRRDGLQSVQCHLSIR